MHWYLSEDEITAARHMVEKIGRRATKLGIPSPSLTVGPAEWKTREEMGRPLGVDGDHGKFEVFRVDLDLPVVKLDGWRFVAKLDRSETPSAIVYCRPGEELDTGERQRAKDAPNECDHCRIDRSRNVTYVIANDDGRRMQVGSTCLKDFLGHDVQRLINLLEWGISLSNTLSEGSGTGVIAWDLDRVLAFTAHAIEQWGWTSKKAERESFDGRMATATEVKSVLCPGTDSRAQEEARQFEQAIPKDTWEKAKRVQEWMESLDSADNDYLMNLHTVAQCGYATHRTLGIACSAIVAYNRAMDTETKRAERARVYEASFHVGEVKKRQSFGLCELLDRKVIETDWGYSTLLKLKTEEGAVLTWFASGSKDFEVGGVYQVKATVKEHKMYRGNAETQISRAVLSEVSE